MLYEYNYLGINIQCRGKYYFEGVEFSVMR
mgnify:CR=1 FL=1